MATEYGRRRAEIVKPLGSYGVLLLLRQWRQRDQLTCAVRSAFLAAAWRLTGHWLSLWTLRHGRIADRPS